MQLWPDQIEFINRHINYLTPNGTIDKFKLFEGSFAELNVNGVNGVFREETQVMMLFETIDGINGNAGVA